MLRCAEQHRRHCHKGGEEEWDLHDPWRMPPQDPNKTSHKSRREEYIWQGCEGRCEASKDSREGIPSACFEETDLGLLECRRLYRSSHAVGIPQCRLESSVVAGSFVAI